MSNEPVLCYVDGPWAWFTTAPLAQQWGDDWNDAPYEHNAGNPYEYRPYRDVPPYEIHRLAFTGQFGDPAWQCKQSYSPWSVRDINGGCVPWLVYPDVGAVKARFMAGMPKSQFIAGILECGGMVYLPVTEQPT